MGILSFIHRKFRNFVNPVIQTSVLQMASVVQHIGTIFPHDAQKSTYTLPAYGDTPQQPLSSPFPVPPEVFKASYCTSDQSYLQSGVDDINMLRILLHESGVKIGDLGRILELGVAGGRLIRHLAEEAQTQEIWGVDCWASAVLWCKEHLSPPFHFATTTVTPHLPFEDRSFGLVFAGSVWTHIDDLAEAWTLEVHRILRPGARFYFTINDRSAIAFFEGGGTEEKRARFIERIRPQNWESWLDLLRHHEGYQRFAKGKAQMVTMGRSTASHVMWDAEYLIKRLGPGWRVCSITPEAYGHQTGVLLERL